MSSCFDEVPELELSDVSSGGAKGKLLTIPLFSTLSIAVQLNGIVH